MIRDRFVAKRFVNLLWILLITMVYTATICLYQGMWIDETIGVLLISLIFYVLFVFALEHSRMSGKLSKNRETDLKKAMVGYAISACLLVSSMFLPEFLRPMMIAPLLMTALQNTEIATYSSIFLCTVFCMGLRVSILEFVLYILMILFACVVAKAIEAGEHIHWCEMIVCCLHVVLPTIFSYLTYGEVSIQLFFYGALEGIAVVLFLRLFYNWIVGLRVNEVSHKLDDILEEVYTTRQELLRFSRAEYQHAQRVSRISAECAMVAGANEKICAAAGFYYRIGILEGEPIAETGVYLAQRECFPEEVIQIISEYNGTISLPSTVESAIVHMVDGLVKKMELLGTQTISGEWNQNMVIYQTLNEFSTDGLYDQSGLSMNMFLKIRGYLVSKELLL